MKKYIFIDFPDDFAPPDDFDSSSYDNNSKCKGCPFYVWYEDPWCDDCQFPNPPENECPLKRYFR